jgi:hypothetical protein
VDELSASSHSSLTRLLEDVESLAYDDEDCAGARARLRSALPIVVQARDDAKARVADGHAAARRADEILARPEFAVDPERVQQPKSPEAEAEHESPQWMQRFFRWLGRLLEKLFGEEPTVHGSHAAGGSLPTHVLIVVLVAGVVVALAYLLLAGRSKSAAGAVDVAVTSTLAEGLSADPRSALARPPEGWASLADELAARGEFREAVRSLYLALLSKLHRLGAIDYDPACSNWDYFRGFKGRREWLPPFRELTSRFDLAYYGQIPVDPEGYRKFKSLSQPLLVVKAEAEVSGA